MDFDLVSYLVTAFTIIGGAFTALSYFNKPKYKNTPLSNLTEPVITISQKVMKGSKVGEYTVQATIQNATNEPVTLTKLIMKGDYEDRSGGNTSFVSKIGTQDFLGSSCTLSSKQPVIPVTGMVEPKISFIYNTSLAQRIVFTIYADAKIGNGEVVTFSSGPHKEYIF